jgi:1-acyl-sn-glycerol-3-phosphate acyltransferase
MAASINMTNAMDVTENLTETSESNTIEATRPALLTFIGRINYWWSLGAAAVLLLILGPPVLFVSWAARRRHWVYPWALFGARLWLRLSGARVRVRGLEHLDPNQTYIFAANHRSYLDTATLFAHLGRRIGLFAKKELLKVPILGYGMSYVNIMAIDRSSLESARTTVRAAVERIRQGRSFGVFVEGTRAPAGKLLPFKKGAFYMAIETNVSIVPVAIKNTDVMMGKNTGTAYPGTIEMVCLPPVETKGFSGDTDVKVLTARVRSMIAEELGLKA